MKNNKYKILVLLDLKESTELVLKNTLSLQKMVQGDIHFFHVTKPTDVIERDSQLSAVGSLNKDFATTDKKMKNLLAPIAEEHKFNLNYKYAVGNVKDEIEMCIHEIQPDLVVLGKKKAKLLNFVGDHITDFVLKSYGGAVMLASNTNDFTTDNVFSLGTFNDFEKTVSSEIPKLLMEHSNTPIKSFMINTKKLESSKQNDFKANTTFSYVFEDKIDVITNLSKYVSKNKINLLFIDRKQKGKKNKSYTNQLINKAEVSILVT